MARRESWLSRLFRSFKQDKEQVEEQSIRNHTVVRSNDDAQTSDEETSPQSTQHELISNESDSWEPDRVLLNEYLIEGILGEGGMGTVYLVARRSSDNQRFAVKTLLTSALEDEERNRLFMRELRTWMELPEHPHTTVCCFFRTIEDRLAIFAEYIDGGTLQQWIRDKRLLTIDKILDISIQCAWGLQAAHDQGVIHQDMKPANVLMTKDGTAKITDFGLAHARQAGGLDALPGEGKKSILVSACGMTDAYCSPEQASWQKLSYRSDMWSWGLSVLEMFTGSVTWTHGSLAKTALDSFMKKGAYPPYPSMPQALYELLTRCFAQDPKKRWASMDKVAEQLQGIYYDETGEKYPRKKPEAKSSKDITSIVHDRRTTGGIKWDDPIEWLEKAYKLSGRDLSELNDAIEEMKGSRKAQGLIDLEVYEKAQRIYSDLIDQGMKDLEYDLSTLLINKAFVHNSVDDIPGAIAMYDKAIEIWERLVHKEGRTELANNLATVYLNKAIAVMGLGDNRAAVEMYDKAIEIWERLVHKEGRTELANNLATVYLNKAIAVMGLGDNRAAVEMYDKAIEIRERLVDKEGRTELLGDLAWVRVNKVLPLLNLGEKVEARDEARQAVSVLRSEVQRTGRADLKNVLAWAESNLGKLLN